MERETFTAWITKYALTSGIDMVEAKLCKEINEKMISCSAEPGELIRCFHGEDWHRTPGAAIDRAEKMRAAKIASLTKQIEKLESMVFVLPSLS